MRKDRVSKGGSSRRSTKSSGPGRKPAGKSGNSRSARPTVNKREGGSPERREKSRSFDKPYSQSREKTGRFSKDRDERGGSRTDRPARTGDRTTERTPYNREDKRKSFSRDKPPFERRSSAGPGRSRTPDRENRERTPYNREDKRRSPSGDKPSYERRSSSGSGRSRTPDRENRERTPYNREDKRRSPSGDKPSYERRSSGGPGRSRTPDRENKERTPFNREDKRRSPSGDKPSYERRSSSGPGRSRTPDRENRERTPYNREDRRRSPSGDKPPYERKNDSREEWRERPNDIESQDKGSLSSEDKGREFPREKRAYEKRSSSRSTGERRPRVSDREENPKSDRASDSGERNYSSDRTSGRDERKPSSFGDKRNERSSRFSSSGSDKPARWNRKEDHQFYGERRRPAANIPKTPEDGSTRLNKFIANAGICSRREADDMIAAGVISVNGQVITEMGYKVKPEDVVKYNNESLRSERLVYILLNKPKDFITTTDDPEDRKTVMSLIAKACKERVYPVGRLDRNTTGVLLFTNDGDMAKKLTHPSFEVYKVYQVELDRALKASDMLLAEEGVRLEDGFIKPDEVVYAGADKKTIGIELHSGKNRIVRRIFEHLGYEVKKLDRVVFAGLTKKDLPRGRWRFLTDLEVASLKMMKGKKSGKIAQ